MSVLVILTHELQVEGDCGKGAWVFSEKVTGSSAAQSVPGCYYSLSFAILKSHPC